MSENVSLTTGLGLTALIGLDALSLAMRCSPAFGRVGRSGMSEDDEHLACLEAISTALETRGGLNDSAPVLMDEVHTTMRLTAEGVAYDPALAGTLAGQLVDLCGGDFDEDGPVAQTYGLDDLGCEAEEAIAGALFAVVTTIAREHPPAEHRRAA